MLSPNDFFLTMKSLDTGKNADVVEGLTWTDNGVARNRSVARMLNHYPESSSREMYCLEVYCPVSGRFQMRADNKYNQIHNPARKIAAHMPPRPAFVPERDIWALDEDPAV